MGWSCVVRGGGFASNWFVFRFEPPPPPHPVPGDYLGRLAILVGQIAISNPRAVSYFPDTLRNWDIPTRRYTLSKSHRMD